MSDRFVGFPFQPPDENTTFHIPFVPLHMISVEDFGRTQPTLDTDKERKTMRKSINDVGLIMRSDSYKTSHWLQYPPGTTNIYSYWESRGGESRDTVMFGMQYYLDEYLSRQVTMEEIDAAEDRINKHMLSARPMFNRKGWEHIVKVHNGFLPVIIRAIPEGTVVPVRTPLFTIENTDPEVPWVTNYVETLLSKLWYPTTVATHSRNIKKIIKRFLEETGGVDGLPFKLHDFGYRGVSSEETAALGGAAHLINFQGTDTMLALELIANYYGEPMAGFSIPAAEHSTNCSWGSENEYDAFKNMVDQFGSGPLYAVVSDQYDIYNAVENLWGEMLKDRVLAAPGTLVVRPDSGTPHVIVREVVEMLGDKFGYTTNDLGYKVLNRVRVIQGDGVNKEEIETILTVLKGEGWSADNVAFGMGGALLQRLDRDTQKFAVKASSMIRNNRVMDIFKDPKTDSGKSSKRGRFKVVEEDGAIFTRSTHDPGKNLLHPVWIGGAHFNDARTTFAEIRERAKL